MQVENNRIERTVNVRKEKLKVLLVDGEPRYEFRYLKNYLEREESIDLGVVLLSSDPEYSEQDRSALPTFPAAKEELFAYDVVLIGDADPSFLSAAQMQNLVEFVTEKGGGLLFIAGENFNPLSYKGTPLEPLLPIELAEARNPSAVGAGIAAFRPELTARGALAAPSSASATTRPTSAQIWQALPELFWFLEAPRKKPAAQVLAVHPTLSGSDGKLPIVLYQFVGAGKSMFNAVDDTWRWRFRVGDRYFGRYWIQTIRFLARSKLLGRRAGRGPDRPPPLPAQPAGPGPGPVPQPRHRPDGRRGRRPGRAQGAGPAQAHAEGVARHAQRLRRGPAAGGRGRVRGPAPAPARPRRPDPLDHLPGRRAGRRAGTRADERTRADPGRGDARGASSTRRPRRRACSRTCPGRRRSRSTPTRRSRSGIPGRSWRCSSA